ncbi:ectoine hydroxylase [Marinicrinis sediminis]|uniref:Ectoine hydroxylase n=1 Tax=Marinicrinis sediminis TaxID=1652465 RepID=A0ABW5R4Y8_9BACL
MTSTTITDLYPSRVGTEVSISQRKDPVVYGQQLPGPLSDEQLKFFEENGYLFLESYFDEEEVRKLQDEMNRMLGEYKGSSKQEVVLEPDGDEVRSIFSVHQLNEIFRELPKQPKLQNAAKQILGSDVYLHQSRINFKPGFTGKEFYWHSDFETWHAEDGMPRMRAFSCSIALTDNYPFNGPLMVMPGSHRQFISCIGKTPDDHYKSSLRKQEYGVPDEDSLKCMADQYGIEMPTGKAGSVLLFDCNILHGSNSNITPYPRSNVFMVFNSVENKLEEPFSGTKPRPEYIAHRNQTQL